MVPEKMPLPRCRRTTSNRKLQGSKNAISTFGEWHNGDGQKKRVVLKTVLDQIIAVNISESTVEIKRSETEISALLALTQSGMPTDEDHKYNVFYGCRTARSFWPTNLKAFTEHGIALHDKNAPVELPGDLIEFVHV